MFEYLSFETTFYEKNEKILVLFVFYMAGFFSSSEIESFPSVYLYWYFLFEILNNLFGKSSREKSESNNSSHDGWSCSDFYALNAFDFEIDVGRHKNSNWTIKTILV